jgi:hypothetical protein
MDEKEEQSSDTELITHATPPQEEEENQTDAGPSVPNRIWTTKEISSLAKVELLC